MASASVRPSKTLGNYICSACRQRKSLSSRAVRTFSSTSRRQAEGEEQAAQPSNTPGNPPQVKTTRGGIDGVSSALNSLRSPNPRSPTTSKLLDILDNAKQMGQVHRTQYDRESREREESGEVHHKLDVFSTKHNTHITFSQPPRLATDSLGSSITEFGASAKQKEKKVDTLISLSCGNLGFRKAARGTYDAAFQLAAYTLKQINERGLVREIKSLELVFRGFGDGREAFQKVLLGVEGRAIRNRIVVVRDSTRLKFGGTRSKKPRRL